MIVKACYALPLYARFRDGRLQGERPAAVFSPPLIPHAIRLVFAQPVICLDAQ
jgi:hypothetical protein